MGEQSLSLRNAQINPGGQALGINAHLWRGTQSLPSPEAEFGRRLARLVDGQLKMTPNGTTKLHACG